MRKSNIIISKIVCKHKQYTWTYELHSQSIYSDYGSNCCVGLLWHSCVFVWSAANDKITYSFSFHNSCKTVMFMWTCGIVQRFRQFIKSRHTFVSEYAHRTVRLCCLMRYLYFKYSLFLSRNLSIRPQQRNTCGLLWCCVVYNIHVQRNNYLTHTHCEIRGVRVRN